MTYTGKIKSYDVGSGSGTIAQEQGLEALSFRKIDLQQQGQEPRVNDTYRYETSKVDGGKRAINLRQEQQFGEDAVREQASNQQG